jgi:hypothetical protein
MNYDKRLLKYIEQFKQKLEMPSEGTEIDTEVESESEE